MNEVISPDKISNLNPFSRVKTLLGEENFEKLKQAHIVLVGYGAVGSFAAEALVRSGIGHIRIIDADVYEASNTNRQLGADSTTIGASKVEIAQKRLKTIHPDLDIECIEAFIDSSNCALVDAPFSDGVRPDILIDAIDTLEAKVSLLAHGYQKGYRVISSMGAARRMKPEMIRYGDISKTEVCPLAREVRKGLRKRGIDRGIGCVYSIEPAAEQTHKFLDGTGQTRLHRPVLGSLITITGAFGLRLASACLDLIIPHN